jgi:hypothetical protein
MPSNVTNEEAKNAIDSVINKSRVIRKLTTCTKSSH